jgi:predicted porin
MSDIFRRMKKPLLTALFVLFAALPLAAQSSEFGILAGGARKLGDLSQGGTAKEIYFGTRVDPETVFRIKVGTADVPLSYHAVDASGTVSPDLSVARGTVTHAEAIVDYRFAEAFGSSGIFAGIGMYRTKLADQSTDTNPGLTAGVNAAFPFSRRTAVMVEGSYHWLHTNIRQRFITVTGGLRFSF